LVNLSRIAVLVHDDDDFQGGGYLLRRLCTEWESQGAQVLLVRPGQKPWPRADLAIFHADVTTAGDEFRELFAYYPRVINGKVTDISKRAISQLVLSPGDDYAGPVIVKTNANFGGVREAARKAGGRPPRPSSWSEVTWMTDYPIFPNSSQLPPAVWENPHLVVEKFLPEHNAVGATNTGSAEFVLRVWVFFGTQSIHYRCISRSPVIKGRNTLRRELLDVDSVPAELVARRAELGFDYGKFDYALVGGKAVLYDANRTPGTPGNNADNAGFGQQNHEGSAKRIRLLSDGLKDFLVSPEAHAS
jgi:hypothetical protein